MMKYLLVMVVTVNGFAQASDKNEKRVGQTLGILTPAPAPGKKPTRNITIKEEANTTGVIPRTHAKLDKTADMYVAFLNDFDKALASNIRNVTDYYEKVKKHVGNARKNIATLADLDKIFQQEMADWGDFQPVNKTEQLGKFGVPGWLAALYPEEVMHDKDISSDLEAKLVDIKSRLVEITKKLESLDQLLKKLCEFSNLY